MVALSFTLVILITIIAGLVWKVLALGCENLDLRDRLEALDVLLNRKELDPK